MFSKPAQNNFQKRPKNISEATEQTGKNPKQIISIFDNLINKLNDKGKNLLVSSGTSPSGKRAFKLSRKKHLHSFDDIDILKKIKQTKPSVPTLSQKYNNEFTSSNENNHFNAKSEYKLNDLKTKLRGSPRYLYKSTTNYFRNLSKSFHKSLDTVNNPNQATTSSVEQNHNSRDSYQLLDLTYLRANSPDPAYFNHFESNQIEELEKTSILKSLLDSHQFYVIQQRIADSPELNIENLDSSLNTDSEKSYLSTIIKNDYDNLEDVNLETVENSSTKEENDTFVEHSSDESSLDEVTLPLGWSYDYTQDGRKYYINHLTQTSHWNLPGMNTIPTNDWEILYAYNSNLPTQSQTHLGVTISSQYKTSSQENHHEFSNKTGKT